MATAPVAADLANSHNAGSAADRRASASTESRSPISAHAPFLHNLSQRFRRGSNVSSNTSDSQSQHAADKSGEGAAAPAQQSHKQQERARADASRAAKRYLMTIVRNDWEFSLESGIPRQKQAHPDSREPVSWRLRDDGSEDELDHGHHHPTSPTKRRGGAAGKSDPYRFESPDAVADYVRERQVKRRKVLHKQMAHNPGLKHWVHERDAWTGAVWRNPAAAAAAAATAAPAKEVNNEESGSADASSADADTSVLGIILSKGDIPDSENSTTRTTSANASNLDLNDHAMDPPSAGAAAAAAAGADDDSPTPDVSASPAGTSADSLVHTTTVTAATSTDPTVAVVAAAAATDNYNNSSVVGNKKTPAIPATPLSSPPDPDAEGPYIPVYPPLFPEDNVLRSRISPATYGTIYSKIVVQSLTPNIPIPLPDMVRALVHGWKAEGQWPPTGGSVAAEAAVAARKGSRGGVGAAAGGAFARWRRERLAQSAARKGGGSGRLGGAMAGGEVLVEGPEGVVQAGQHRHRVRRSISSVAKRVFGKDDEERRVSEVGLTVGFEEEDDDDEAGGVGIGMGNDDEKLNRALLVDEETARARAAAS